MSMDLSKLTDAQLRRELSKRATAQKKATEAKKKRSKRSSKTEKKEEKKEDKKPKRKVRSKRAKAVFRVSTFQENLDDDDDDLIPRLALPKRKFIVLDKKKINLFRKKDSTFDYNYAIKPVPLTESTVKFLSKNIHELASAQIAKVRKQYPAGVNVHIKTYMHSDGISASAVVAAGKLKDKDLYSLIYNSLYVRCNKHYATKDYILDVQEVSVLVTGYGSHGGCNASNPSHDKITIDKNSIIYLTSHKSKDNNCLIACFNHAYGVAGNVMKASTVRRELGLDEGEKIDMDKINEISKFYNKKFDKDLGYVLINQSYEIIKFSHPTGKSEEEHDHADDQVVRLYIAHEHYFSYDVVVYYKCEECGKKLSSRGGEHTCNINCLSYHNTMVTKKKDMVKVKKIEAKEKIDYEEIIHWDLETFQPVGAVRHQVYASGFYDKKYKVYYGEGSLDKTIDEFLSMTNKTITAYNGSGFDFYFMIDALTARNVTIENMLINNGRVMSFEFYEKERTHKNKVFDLYLFTMSKLVDACSDFKIENAKSSFDHSKMKTWEDVDTYKSEVKPYLKLDVMGMKELFEKFNDMVFETQKVNITQFLTASHMGYNIWCNTAEHVIEIPKCQDKMKFIKAATYGGRTYPQQMMYKSGMYDDIKAGKKTYADLMKSGDFIYNGDATSLYPASMSGFEHMKVKYPIGRSRWSEDPKSEYDSGKLGFYEVEYKPPTDLRIAVLPRKKMNKGVNIGVEWSLHEGSGVYTSVDIMNAIEAGYEMKFVNKALVYDEKGDVFSKYIKSFYQLKERAEREGNDCLRSIAKLLLNSLYGKMLQSPTVTSSEIVNTVVDLHKFLIKYNLTDWQILNDHKVLITGDKKDYVSAITKPSQLGAYVTAYSRRIMLFYMKEIDPTLKSQIYTYTDTDSLHISGESYLKFVEKGYVKSKAESKLGFLCNDIKGEGLIIRETNLAPKTYLYEYITADGKIGTTMKCKGIPKKCLQEIDFEKHGRAIPFSGLKKKNKLTKSDREQGIAMFSVTNLTQTRTFMKNSWRGMDLINNEFYPGGYDLDLIKD